MASGLAEVSEIIWTLTSCRCSKTSARHGDVPYSPLYKQTYPAGQQPYSIANRDVCSLSAAIWGDLY